MKLSALAFFYVFISLIAFCQTPQRKVLFIGVDGCRWDAIVAANTPAIDGLLSTAVYSGNGLTEYKTWSGTGWSNMLTGTWHTKHGVTDNTFSGSNFAQYPDFITRMEAYNPALRTVSIVHWASLNTSIIQVADSKLTLTTDSAVKNAAVNTLLNDNPDLLFVAFDDVDHSGHTVGFSPSIPAYVQTIETTDGYIAQILTALHSRPNYSNEDWLIVLTTDHGGNPAGHGGGTLEERTIFNIYSNPGLSPQFLSRSTVSNTATFNEAHFNAGTYAVPVNQSPFVFGSTQDFTVECWVKANTYTSDPAIISNKNWNSGANKGFVISTNSGQFWKVNIGDGTNRLDIQGGYLSPNAWHHLAVSFDRDGLMTVYEDGVVVGFEKMQTIGNIDAGLPLVINQDGTKVYGSNFDGSIRDIRIWNSVIPDSVIVQWATIPVNATHPFYNNLLANWKCVDGAGSTLLDASPNANSCAITGTMSWVANQTNTFSVYDYSRTTREPDNAVTALTWLCVPIPASWNLDGKSWVASCNNAAVIIAQTGGANPICQGSSATFTATPFNGGSAPAYQWKVNGINTGSNSPVFTTTSLTNGQVLSCVMTSNLPGVSGNPATSNAITISVSTPVVASLNISQTVGTNPACAGNMLAFSAIPVNGGASPVYQWLVNGTATGFTGNIFQTSTLTQGQVVSCRMTSSASCVSVPVVNSNTISMSINPVGNPVVSITNNAGANPVCSGTPVTFTASVSGGIPSVYQWKVNGVNAGSNSSSFTTSSLSNGQLINCTVTSSISCPVLNVQTLGTGTTLNATNTPLGVAYPTYYGNGRQQYVIRATELTALGLSSGNILSLGFNIAGTTGDPSTMNGYTIKIGAATASTASTSFQTPVFTPVFGPVNYTPVLNTINTHTFISPYFWNGTTDLVLDICFSNQVVGHVAYQNTYSTATFTASTYYQADGAAGAGACSQATGTTTNRRPNIIFSLGNVSAIVNSNTITIGVTQPQIISAFTPDSGAVGSMVLITGSGFVNVSDVKFNGIPASIFTVNDSSQITAQVPFSLRGPVAVTTSACGTVSSFNLFTPISDVTLNVKAYLEGFYRGGGYMTDLLSGTITDTVTINLASAISPFPVRFSIHSTLSTNGHSTSIFNSVPLGTSYYVVLKHRNSLETWSAVPIQINTGTVGYDFSTSAGTAYGNNLVNLNDGNFALWSGDINQDGIVDSSDYSRIENDAQNFLFGYYSGDLTGDNIVESQDYSLIENNAQLFLIVIRP